MNDQFTKKVYEAPVEIVDLAQSLDILGHQDDIQYFERPGTGVVELRLHQIEEPSLLALLGISPSGEVAFTGLRFSPSFSETNKVHSNLHFGATSPVPDAIATLEQPTQESRGKAEVLFHQEKYSINLIISRLGDTFSVDFLPDPNFSADIFATYCELVSKNLKTK